MLYPQQKSHTCHDHGTPSKLNLPNNYSSLFPTCSRWGPSKHQIPSHSSHRMRKGLILAPPGGQNPTGSLGHVHLLTRNTTRLPSPHLGQEDLEQNQANKRAKARQTRAKLCYFPRQNTPKSFWDINYTCVAEPGEAKTGTFGWFCHQQILLSVLLRNICCVAMQVYSNACIKKLRVGGWVINIV